MKGSRTPITRPRPAPPPQVAITRHHEEAVSRTQYQATVQREKETSLPYVLGLGVRTGRLMLQSAWQSINDSTRDCTLLQRNTSDIVESRLLLSSTLLLSPVTNKSLGGWDIPCILSTRGILYCCSS
ncbi:hypothetical protein FJTKL_00139 [Diaporthe vaccinii]|uniref:Uncharacterized protein n=1 Tax=Diaporthe vaccinii TaxID=105482 RepID=A0ABR4E4G4_9PEZI